MTKLYLNQPIWLLLFIPLLIILWKWHVRSKLMILFRILSILFIVLAMCQPFLKISKNGGNVIIIADRSFSMPIGIDQKLEEEIKLIQKSQPRAGHLSVISFAEKVFLAKSFEEKRFHRLHGIEGKNGSALFGAIDKALSLINQAQGCRFLILSDGLYTGKNPVELANLAAFREISIDFRYLQRDVSNDFAITKIDAPSHATPREVYIVTVWIKAPYSGNVILTVSENNKIAFKKELLVVEGLNPFQFRAQGINPGTKQYSVKVFTKETKIADEIPENNSARFIISIIGKRHILHISDKHSQLVELLKESGINCDSLKSEQIDWSLASLSNYAGLILENVSVGSLGRKAMENISAWITQRGRGLLISGGKNSFGLGGYFHSPLDKIMPVSMELREEKHKLNLAIVVVLDRSGSMTLPVTGGKRKMDLANIATSQTIELLGDNDEIGVIAVDSSAHIIVPLNAKKDIPNASTIVLQIQSQGGGIFIGEALKAALSTIVNSKSMTRHILLFADAADSEKPENYKEIVDKAAEVGITISVIGLGTPNDRDAPLLQDIAYRGKGRCYFTNDSLELPRLFTQETFLIARNSFVDKKVKAAFTPGLHELIGKSFKDTISLGGYNLCYLRPAATLAATTSDENKAPLIAAWQAGIGRVVCYMGEIDGAYTGAMADWPNSSFLYSSLVRWMSSETSQLPEDMVVTQSKNKDTATVSIYLNPETEAIPFNQIPILSMLSRKSGVGETNLIKNKQFKWQNADKLVVNFPLSTKDILPYITVKPNIHKNLDPVCLIYSPEFNSVDRNGREILAKLAEITGGKERLDLSSIWNDIPQKVVSISIASWFVLIALLFFILEIIERRFGLISRIVFSYYYKKQGKKIYKTDVIKEKYKSFKKKSGLIINKNKTTTNDLAAFAADSSQDKEKSGNELTDALNKTKERIKKKKI